MLRPMPDSQSEGAKKWGIGVELAEDHLGPVRFVAELTEGSQDLNIGIHVLPNQELLHPLVNHDEAREMRELVSKDVSEVLTREGLSEARTRVELVEDDEVERGLGECAERQGLDALIVGRRAKRDEDPIVRLGEVTRRLLRRLPVPLVVVPPDFGEGEDPGFGEGPVIVGVDLSEHCTAAVVFAKFLADRLGRELILAHGTQAFHWGVSYIPAATMERLQKQASDAAGNQLREWAAPLGVSGARQFVFMGDPAKNLLELAVAEEAAIIVTGSRQLGPVERLFLASVSTEVAAAASCPVAVIPGS
jgi:nucleotide-binding universal stress UspA family protein